MGFTLVQAATHVPGHPVFPSVADVFHVLPSVQYPGLSNPTSFNWPTSAYLAFTDVSFLPNTFATVNSLPTGPVMNLSPHGSTIASQQSMMPVYLTISTPVGGSVGTWPSYMQPHVAPPINYGASTQYTHMNPAAPEFTMPSGEQQMTPQLIQTGRSPSGSHRDIRLKKIVLPTFSGLRKDWPEFKAVWKQLAENAYRDKTDLAHELKRSVRGEASQRIKSVDVTKPEAYDIMWNRLETHYDASASVQAALNDLQKLKPVKEQDYKGLVHLVDEVESAYCQLEELNRLNTLTMRDVDFVNELLPNHLKVEWIRKYHDMSPTEKVQPFTPFMKFLERERAAVTRLAENQPKPKAKPETSKTGDREKWQSHHSDSSSNNATQQRKRYRCVHPKHRRDTINHSTSECKEFQKLPINARFDLLEEVYACFICFAYHRKENCPNRKPCSLCGRKDHNYLLCKSEKPAAGEKVVEVPKSSNQTHTQAATHASQSASLAYYPIHQAKVSYSDKSVTIFCDDGSNTTYITH